MSKVRSLLVIGVCIAIIVAAIQLFSHLNKPKQLTYDGVIVDVLELERISSEINAGISSGETLIYKVNTETNLPMVNTMTIQGASGEKIISQTVNLEVNGKQYSLCFENNCLISYVDFSKYDNNQLAAVLAHAPENDAETLEMLFEEYSAAAPKAIQQYLESQAKSL